MKKIYFPLILVCLSFLTLNSFAQTTTFSVAGSANTYTVGAGVTTLQCTVNGGKGGNYSGSVGGAGGRVTANLAVTAGEVLYIYVGGSSANGLSGIGGLSAGGEQGGNGGTSFGGCGGGAASDIRTNITGGATTVASLNSRVLVGGGGGGADYSCSFTYGGGAAGNPSGANGPGGDCAGGTNPTGGTQVTFGAGGHYSTFFGGAGAQGSGGAGIYYGGGGGGGYYGGGGSASTGGAGGSSYAGAGTSSVVYSANAATGSVVITVPCNAIGAITGTLTVCAGSTTTLADATGFPGGTWTSSNTAVGTVDPVSGVVAGITPGTTTITYVVPSPCGGSSATATVTVNAVAGAITGTAGNCMGSAPVTLSSSPAGGTWTSGSTGVATIGSSTGTVTNVSPGTSTITYNLGNGCATSTRVFTVNAIPIISGTLTVCATQTTTLSGAPSGGSWVSSNTALATVDPATGIVTGVAPGNPIITYTSLGGCVSSSTITVNALSVITGSLTMCLGTGTTLSDATPGGTWTSGNTGVATIGTTTGIVNSVALGSAPISYTVTATGCRATTTVNVTGPATAYSITGGGSYCAGGIGVHIGVNSSDLGGSYTLYNGITLVGGPVTGTGGAIDFGLFTAPGIYTAKANVGTACANTMSGTVTVSTNPLPIAFSVTGGGAYCSGGTGVHVFLSSSTIGVNYQLFYGATPVGSLVLGSGGSLDFGLVTSASLPNYTVVATNATTLCQNTMAGSASVSINPLPAAFAISGGGSYCLGGTGVLVGLTNSAVGINYQLFLSGSPIGVPLAGTGSALNFGFQTSAGTYTVVATNPATGCTSNMSGPVTITINPLPTVFTVTGGGAYCLGGTGVAIGLNASTIGINYQLYNGGTPVAGALLAGTGVALDFGLQTVAGSYTVVATNATTGCQNNMFGSASVSINPLPAVFSVTGGGSYCSGGPGLHVGLSSSSTPGRVYTLYNGATVVGALPGTGSALDFGLFTAAGTYTVVASITSTGCVGNMAGSVTITINPLPGVFSVTGGGNYCAGGTGMAIGLSGSALGINYQLFNGALPVGSPVAGTGGIISFGLQTAAGSYSVVATNATTGCTNNMTGSAVIIINPLPTVYAVTGGGGYCAGGAGVNIGLSASDVGINYQLFNGGPGPTLAGTGAALAYPLQTAVGTYTIVATNPATGCVTTMSGSAIVSINPLPIAFSVSGGGSYCAGGAGLPVTLSNSVIGRNYQLYNGVTMVGGPLAGTGSPLNFGLQTGAGTYTVIATNATTGCTSNMTGSAVISINPLPAVFSVTGGGSYCTGGAGVHVGISGSVSGTTTYQLFNSGVPSGLPVTGTGSAIDFGFKPAGSYTVVATITATGCTNNMSGTITVSVNPLPGLYTISGGGSYCSGGAGLHIGLGGSSIGINYQLYNGVTPVGSPIPGSSAALDFGLQTAAGTYTITGTDMTTGCSSVMTGSATIIVNTLPVLHTVTGGGSYCPSGTGVAIGLNGSNTGTSYQLYNGASPIGLPVPGNTGFPITFGLQTAAGVYTVIATTAPGCNGNMTGSATVGIYSLPVVYNVTGGGSYCAGGTGVNVGLSGSNIGINYQLFNGASPLGIMPGTGVALNFGLQTGAGIYTIVATSVSTGCFKTMNVNAVVSINPLPTPYTITGGGDYCSGGTGVVIGLNGSDVGTHYQLYNGISTVGTPVSGTGSPISFGLQTVAGTTYTVQATNISTTCVNIMSSSVAVVIDPLPTAYTVTGGGSYCSGTGGVNIFLGGSDPANTYQLYNGATPVGIAQPGTNFPLTFGPVMAAGTYTIVATSLSTGCSKTMTGSVPVTINPLPTTYILTGGGSYCAGSAGLHIFLSGSNAGITYQLMNGGPVGAPKVGTGLGLDFGLQTLGGTYSVVATNTATTCTNTMGSVNITVNPLPTPYTVVSTSSSYCIGGPGVYIALTSSDVGTTYQLFNGSTTIGSPVAGTGDSINFGYILPAGAYTVVATITATGCSANMAPGVTITVNPLPTAYSVTGGGQYCTGGAGVHVGLSGSVIGTNYQLMHGVTAMGSPVAGTGSALDFGFQALAGNYTVVATTPLTTCTNTMSGSATVVIDPLPGTATVTGGGVYCAGGTGVAVGLNGSAPGVNYQLFRGVATVGSPMAGTGTSLNFGLETGAGTYTVVATNALTGCANNMLSSATVSVNPLPVIYTVTGGGSYCPGGSGVHVGVSGSDSGINYQLYNGVTMIGAPKPGTHSGIDFGLQAAAGTYTVIATDAGTGCTSSMSGSTTVMINALPVVYNVIGGGNYCAGGTGVDVGLNNSSVGVNYTLYGGAGGIVLIGTSPGVGGPLNFGPQTLAGPYTILATDATTTCSAYMSGSVTVGINPLVTPSVTISSGSGDTVCSGVFVTFTALAVNGGGGPAYQWTVNGAPSGAGSSYSYAPSNGDIIGVTMTSSAACAVPAMVSTSKTITVNPTQTPLVSVAANPGSDVCQGTTVTYTATPSFGGTAPTYSWVKNGGTVIGATSSTLSFVPLNHDVVSVVMTSNYHCRLSTTATSNEIDMTVDVPLLPVVTITTNPGANIAAGQTETLSATVVNGGPVPGYQWFVNGAPISGATTSIFVSSDFVNKDSVTCQVTSSGGCLGLVGFNSVIIHVNNVGVTQINTAGSDIQLVPNPNKGTFTVKGTLGTTIDQEVSLELTNMLGQVIYSNKIMAHNGDINEKIQISNTPANGMYILNLRSGTESKVFHMVIEQ